MIVGTGCDIIQIPRIEKIYNRFGTSFETKILHPQELGLLKTLPKFKIISFLAKRFAAKEAISKAVGTGIGRGMQFKDIAVLNDEAGRPFVIIENNNFAQSLKIDITLSDDYPIAMAFVVISTYV